MPSYMTCTQNESATRNVYSRSHLAAPGPPFFPALLTNSFQENNKHGPADPCSPPFVFSDQENSITTHFLVLHFLSNNAKFTAMITATSLVVVAKLWGLQGFTCSMRSFFRYFGTRKLSNRKFITLETHLPNHTLGPNPRFGTKKRETQFSALVKNFWWTAYSS